MTRVDVAVGVIYRQQHVFVAQRPPQTHQGGKWEFPGGKVEPQETPVQALARELQEEVGLVGDCDYHPLMTVRHDYGDKQVCLHVFVVENFHSEPHGKEGQAVRWQEVAMLDSLDFPAANTPIIAAFHAWLATRG